MHEPAGTGTESAAVPAEPQAGKETVRLPSQPVAPLAPWLILVGLCALLFFYGIHIGELYRTESLRAIVAAEFLRTGNWAVPTLYGEPLLTKPPGIYALIALASWPFGAVSEWTARLPSAWAATLTVLLFYWYGARHLGRIGGLVLAVSAPCSFLWLEKAGTAEIDMVQVFWVAAALMFFFRAMECYGLHCANSVRAEGDGTCRPARAGSRWLWWMLALLCVAGGVLTKWTAPVFFYPTALAFLAWHRRLRVLLRPEHLLSAVVAALLCLGWVALVAHQVGWDVFYQTVMQEALPRLSHAHHVATPLETITETALHPGKLWAVNLPWALLALLTFWPAYYRELPAGERWLATAFHAWAWPNLLVWTILPDHATRHSFPLFPGIVGLGALVAWRWLCGHLAGRAQRITALTLVVAAAVYTLAAIGFAGVALWRWPRESWLLAAIVSAITVWVAWETYASWRAGLRSGLFFGLVLLWCLVKLSYTHFYVPVRNAGREPRAKGLALREHVPEGQILYVFQAKDEGIMFYYGRPVRRLQNVEALPRTAEPQYFVLTEKEFEHFRRREDWKVDKAVRFPDEQGDPMFLVQARRVEPPILEAVRRLPPHRLARHEKNQPQRTQRTAEKNH